MAHSYKVRIDRRGRMVLPSGVRQQLGVEQDQTLILEIHEGGDVHLFSPQKLVHEGRGLLHALAPMAERNRSLVEELIAERRSVAERE